MSCSLYHIINGVDVCVCVGWCVCGCVCVCGGGGGGGGGGVTLAADKHCFRDTNLVIKTISRVMPLVWILAMPL